VGYRVVHVHDFYRDDEHGRGQPGIFHKADEGGARAEPGRLRLDEHGAHAGGGGIQCCDRQNTRQTRAKGAAVCDSGTDGRRPGTDGIHKQRVAGDIFVRFSRPDRFAGRLAAAHHYNARQVVQAQAAAGDSLCVRWHTAGNRFRVPANAVADRRLRMECGLESPRNRRNGDHAADIGLITAQGSGGYGA